VDSVLNKGSTFHLVVGFGMSEAPRPLETTLIPRVPALPATTVLPPLRILLVEDNRINQRTVRRLLEKRGHTVVVAENGEIALQCLDRESFDLALMDVHMPVLDGYAATSAIRGREHSTGRHLPIVAMTANAMKGDEDRCLAAGMDGYVSKPIQVHELLTVIARVISKDSPLLTSRAASISAQLVFDPQQALAQVEGDEAELRFLIGMFLEEEPRSMVAIREAIARNDRAALKLTVHNLKGMISSLGGHLAAEAADQLEQLGDQDPAVPLEPALQRLSLEMDRLVAVLKNLEAGKPL
jgi:CheY-like chemotaxis protein/HPt (histidine-containing phosphotransfer) domain-containing protein